MLKTKHLERSRWRRLNNRWSNKYQIYYHIRISIQTQSYKIDLYDENFSNTCTFSNHI